MTAKLDQPGALLAGRYEVVERLGQGAMGLVLRVRDQGSGELLALKTIAVPDQAWEEARLRFKEEFRAMARLAHPNAVRVHEFGSLGDRQLYLTMDEVPGEDLDRRLARGPLPLAEASSVITQLLQALTFIHGRGYVHRDVKAANLRLGPDGHLTLMDFGLMAQVGRSGGAVSGTPGYLAPEAVQGGPLLPGVDVYAVGCLAYELLAGRLPFQGSLREVLRGHLQERPAPLQALRPELPTPWLRWLEGMLAKDPHDRFPDGRRAAEAWAIANGRSAPPECKAARHSYLIPGKVVGREREWQALGGAWQAARGGQGGAWVLEGPPGLGKSRLMAELSLQAKLDEALVLSLRCVEGGELPFAALREALRPALAWQQAEGVGPRPQAVEALLDPSQAGGACVLSQGGEEACLQGLATWLAELSHLRPILLVLEDLHWADAGVLGAMRFLCAQAQGARLLVVASWRAEEGRGTHPVAQLQRDGLLEGLRLAPLDGAGVRALVEAMLGEVELGEATAQALTQASGGNPLYVAEAVRILMQESRLPRASGRWRFPDDPAALGVPPSVEAAVAKRLGRLCGRGRHLAEVAAVVGPKVALPRLLAVAHLEEDQTFTFLEELTELQFLAREASGDYVFAHDRVREVLLEAMAPEAKAALHRELAERLEREAEALGPEGARGLAPERARHLLAAGELAQALPWILEAAQAAEGLGAEGVAAAWWIEARRAFTALDDPTWDPQRLAADRALAWHSLVLQPEEARLALEDALRVNGRLETLGQGLPPVEVGELWGLLAVVQALMGHGADSARSAAEARRHVPEDRSSGDAAVRFVAVHGRLAMGHFDEAIALAKAGAAVLGPMDPGQMRPSHRGARVVAFAYQNAKVWQGEAPDLEALERALEAARDNGDEDPFSAWAPIGVHAALHGDLPGLERYLEASLARSRRLGAPPYGWARILRPWMLAQRGELRSALALMADALECPEVHHSGLGHAFARAHAGELAWALEDWPAAQGHFADLLAAAPPEEAPFAAAWAHQGLAWVAMDQGRLAEARPHLQASLALVQPGQPGRNPWLEGRAWRALGQLELRLRDPWQAQGPLHRALERFSQGPLANPIEEAFSRLAWGQALQAQGDRLGARQQFVLAGDRLAERQHALGLAAASRALEAWAGGPSPGPAGPVGDPAARWRLALALGG